MDKTSAQNKAIFARLKYEDYSKLPKKAQEAYNVKEREYNFNKKMERKYGPKTGQRKLKRFFSDI